jgi:hypothetical protein
MAFTRCTATKGNGRCGKVVGHFGRHTYTTIEYEFVERADRVARLTAMQSGTNGDT